MGKISKISTLLALSKPFQQKTKQQHKEVQNDDQLKPSLVTFQAYFGVWPVTEKVWSVTLVALFNTDKEPKTNSTTK